MDIAYRTLMENDVQQLIPAEADGKQPTPTEAGATQPTAEAQPIIIYAVPQPGPTVRSGYNGRMALVLGSLLIASAALCVIFNITLMITISLNHSFAAHGLWVGAVYIVAGVLTILASKWKTTAMIISSLVLCIVSTIFTIVLIAISAGGIATAPRQITWRYGEYNSTLGKYVLEDQATSALMTSHALDGMMIALGLLCFVCAVWAASLSCRTFDCCRSPTTSDAQVHYNIQHQQKPLVLMIQKPMAQQGDGMTPVTMVTL